MQRKIYNELLAWKNADSNKPLMVLGVRQAGKTYIINEFCQKEFTNYAYVNLLENENIVKLYEKSIPSSDKYFELKALLNLNLDAEDTVLFIDEIQESERIIAELKYFCEQHNKVKIICAGSLLGIKLRRSHFSFPVGKVKMITLYPMDFEEFLIACGESILLDVIKDSFNNNKNISLELHTKALHLYNDYLITGGMPEVVKNFIDNNRDYVKCDFTILNNIVEFYLNDMNKYVKSNVEALKISRTYHSLPSQLSNNSAKFQYAKISKNAKAREYESVIDWLISSNMVLEAKAVKKPNIPLENFVDINSFKLYLSDIGILNSILKIQPVDIINDRLSLYKGVIAQNYVACELKVHGHNLYYWKSDNTAEIDFLIHTDEGIIPIEVKAGNNTKSKSLAIYIEKYKPKYAIRISTKEFGYNHETKIKSIPLYATFLL